MNITPRTCANCASFDLAGPHGSTCMNAARATNDRPGLPDESHGATASDWCDEHQTAEEAA